ncbi:tetratricopeptide repeat protein [Niabella aquatica]
MGITTEQYEKIIRFLDGEMEAAEMEAFEKELAANPEMRHQLDFEQSLRDSFALKDITCLPGTVAPAEIPGKVRRMQKWLTIGSAAAVIIAIVLFMAPWQKPGTAPDIANRKNIDTTREESGRSKTVISEPAKDSSNDIDLASLFKKYFKKEPLPEEYPIFLAEALMDYEQGNYATLQKLNLNDLPQTRGPQETDRKKNILQLGHYYKGIAYLETGNTGKAIAHFNWVLKNQPDTTLKAKTQWYLALAYLKEKNREKAAELCRSIINHKGNHVLIKNAAIILNTLEK